MQIFSCTVQALRLCKSCRNYKSFSSIDVLYRHWGSVQAVRPIVVQKIMCTEQELRLCRVRTAYRVCRGINVLYME